jgi:hypothetical protein
MGGLTTIGQTIQSKLTAASPRSKKATDWEYAGVMTTAASVGLIGGGWMFSFRSKSAGVTEDFVLVAVGVATPGLVVEVSLPDLTTGDLCWSPITSRPFSAVDLASAGGLILTGGVSAVYGGWSSLFLSAGPSTKGVMTGPPYFSNQRNDGFAVGIEFKPGVSGAAVGGTFVSLGSVLSKVIVTAVNTGILSIGVGTGLFQAGDALLAGRGMAVLNVFCEGYAAMLAEITDAGNWTYTESYLERLDGMNWEGVVNRCGQTVQKMGSRTPNGTYDDAREAGMACVYQAVNSMCYALGQKDYFDALGNSQRSMYGSDKNQRRKRYEQILFEQVKKGKTAKHLGIRLVA